MKDVLIDPTSVHEKGTSARPYHEVSNHVVTALLLEVVGEDASLNEIAEMERRALEEERDLPQVRQGEGGEEEGLRQVQVLEGVQGLPPGVVYGLEWSR